MSAIPSKSEVEGSVEENLRRLGTCADELGELIENAPRSIASRKGSSSQKLFKLLEVADEISKVVGKVAPCRQGCSHCCRMAVTIGSAEARVIGEAIRVPPSPVPAVIRTHDEVIEKYMQVPCVFLKRGSCQIYDHRPIVCRTYFNLSDYPELCSIDNKEGTVPCLDLRPLEIAMASIMMSPQESVGDIREFFPDGLNPIQSL